MNIYITKNGGQLGPYTIAEAQQLVANGTLVAADWAWYEGIPNWIPLQNVPGFASGLVSDSVPAFASVPDPASVEASSPVRRPVLVWIICLLYFITIPLGLVSLAITPYLLSFSTGMLQRVDRQIQVQLDRTSDPDEKARLEATLSQLKNTQAQVGGAMHFGILYYALAVLSMILNLVAAILLFTLRRSAFPAFAMAFGVGVLGAIYNYSAMSFFHGGLAQRMGTVLGLVVGWGISIAILFYVWSLRRRSLLR